jgi:hypothetical protein
MVVKIPKNLEMKSLLPAPRSRTSFSQAQCKWIQGSAQSKWVCSWPCWESFMLLLEDEKIARVFVEQSTHWDHIFWRLKGKYVLWWADAAIEEELERTIFKAGGIIESNFGNLTRILLQMITREILAWTMHENIWTCLCWRGQAGSKARIEEEYKQLTEWVSAGMSSDSSFLGTLRLISSWEGAKSLALKPTCENGWPELPSMWWAT